MCVLREKVDFPRKMCVLRENVDSPREMCVLRGKVDFPREMWILRGKCVFSWKTWILRGKCVFSGKMWILRGKCVFSTEMWILRKRGGFSKQAVDSPQTWWILQTTGGFSVTPARFQEIKKPPLEKEGRRIAENHRLSHGSGILNVKDEISRAADGYRLGDAVVPESAAERFAAGEGLFAGAAVLL